MSTTKGTSPNATSNYTTCKLWQIICYSMVPAVGNFFMIVFTMNAYIAKGGYGLATALAASIASSGKLFDAVTDGKSACSTRGCGQEHSTEPESSEDDVRYTHGKPAQTGRACVESR